MSNSRAIRALVLTSLAALSAATFSCASEPGPATTKPGAAVASAAERTVSSAGSKSSVAAANAPGATATAPQAQSMSGAASSGASAATATAGIAAGATGSPGAATAEPHASSQDSAPPNTITPRPAVQLTAQQVAELDDLVAELATSQGTVVFDFLPEKAPGTVANFVELARSGFYDGLSFHRVIPGLFIQGGDPTGTGDGGPGYFIRAEFNDEPHVRGTVSMARLRHPDSAGSQFFICLATLPYLDGGYTAFGHVLAGDEVLDRIEKLGRATPQGTPSETITIEKVTIRPRSPAERPTASRQP